MTERRIILRSYGTHTQEQQPEKIYLSSLHEWITQVLLFYCFRPIFNEHVITTLSFKMVYFVVVNNVEEINNEKTEKTKMCE